MKSPKLILSVVIAVSAITVSFSQDGEQLFKANCASCHTVGKGKLVGPDLRDVQNRYEKSWILKWVKSSQTLVKAGDTQAVKLFNDNNKIPMPDQALSEDQIGSILNFIVSKSADISSGKVTEQASVSAPVVSSDSKIQNGNPLNSFNFTEYLLLGLLIMLLIVIWVLSKSIQSMSNQLTGKTGADKNQ